MEIGVSFMVNRRAGILTFDAEGAARQRSVLVRRFILDSNSQVGWRMRRLHSTLLEAPACLGTSSGVSIQRSRHV